MEEIQLLQKFIKARDTLIVWKRLTQSIGLEQNIGEDVFHSSQKVIKKAEEFKEWFKENQDRLSQLPWIDFTNFQLSSLPPEIGTFFSIKHLSLSHNQFRFLPPEIGMLSALQVLYLNDNQLSSLSSEIKKLSS